MCHKCANNFQILPAVHYCLVFSHHQNLKSLSLSRKLIRIISVPRLASLFAFKHVIFNILYCRRRRRRRCSCCVRKTNGFFDIWCECFKYKRDKDLTHHKNVWIVRECVYLLSRLKFIKQEGKQISTRKAGRKVF